MSRSPEWTDAEVRVAKAAWVKGLSASRIAGEIWTQCKVRRSRNAVIGWITRNKARHSLPERLSPDSSRHRGGFPQPKVAQRRGRSGQHGAEVQRARKARDKALAGPPRDVVQRLPVRRRVKAEGIPEPLNLNLMQLTDKTCRFAVTEEAPYRFCGHPSTGSWCDAHAAIVFAQPVPAQAAA